MEDTLRSFEAKVDDADKEDRCITFRISSKDIDSHSTVIDPSGGRFERYRAMKGPVLWHHGQDPKRGFSPIAKNKWVQKFGKTNVEIRARDQFLEDEFSDQVFNWYKDEVLSGVSLRFADPKEDDYGPPTNDEIRARPELEPLRTIWRETQGKRGWILRSWDLVEHSCTPIPSNPNTFSVGRSLQLLECCRSGLWLPDDVRVQLEARAATEAKETSEATDAEPFVNNDGKSWWIEASGRRIATFTGAEQAEECFRIMLAPRQPKLLSDRLSESLGQIRGQGAELRQDIDDYIRLYRWGQI